MDAYKIFEEHDLLKMLRTVEYITPSFRNTVKVREYLTDIVRSNASVKIIGDCDVDGLMCTLIMYEGLKDLGVVNISLQGYTSRSHKLNPVVVQECIQRRFDYCIICDCGSQDIGLLRMLDNYGVKTILLDHHQTMTDYEEFEQLSNLAIINSALEETKYALSAGALCYCVMDDLYNSLGRDATYLAAYGVISLFSDCMNMSDSLNRAIYFKAVKVPKENLPANVRMFMNEYQTLTNRFITFWMAPRINAMFRSENFDVLNVLFLQPGVDASVKASCLEFINTKYEEIRDLVHKVADLIEIEDFGGVIVGNLQSVNSFYSVKEHKLWNYTGLVANMLSSNYSKPAFVYCQEENNYKGSVRDLYGRDYLTIFRQLCRADGHKPAFGCHIPVLDFDDFMFSLRRVAKKMALISPSNKPIILEYKYGNPDNALIEDIALLNEFAGQDVPVILIQKQLLGGIKETKTKYNYKYNWGDYFIQSQYALGFGSVMLLKPIKAYKTKLIVQ